MILFLSRLQSDMLRPIAAPVQQSPKKGALISDGEILHNVKTHPVTQAGNHRLPEYSAPIINSSLLPRGGHSSRQGASVPLLLMRNAL